jgi:tetratricopeptide (TPR) repeat protein
MSRRDQARSIRAFDCATVYQSSMEVASHGMLDAISRALVALRERRLDDAENLAGELLRLWPRDAATHQLAAEVALQRGRYDEAESWARSSLALRPDHPPAMMIAGRASLARGDSTGAKDWFRRAGEFPAAGPKPMFQLCLAQIETADPDAPATMANLARQFPGEALGWRDIGLALMRVNQLEAAEAALTRAAKASKDPAHSVDLGRVRLARGRAAEAVAPLRRALEAAPDRPDALLPLAQALRLIGAPREALQHLRRLAGADSNRASVFYAMGLVCGDLRDWPGAIAAYRRCLELSPEMPEAHVNLGLALQQLGELGPAVDCYRRAMQLRPDTFGRIAQALPSTQKGMLWLDTRRLRRSLAG